MNKKRIFYIAVLLIVFVLFLVVSEKFFNLTGKAVSSEFACSDSDGGENYFVKGEVKVGDVSKGIDLCTSETRLKEYYCLSETSWNNKYKECAKGCEEGVCVSECGDIGEIQEGKYCDNDKKLKLQEEIGESCENDFECVSEFCSSGICEEFIEDVKEEVIEKEEQKETGLFKKFICMIKSIFSGVDYKVCVLE